MSSQPSFSQDDFAQALEQYNYDFKKGQIVRGKVYEYGSEGAYVDIGGKSSGFVPYSEVSLGSDADLAELPKDEELDFLILKEQNADGQVTLSRRQLQIRQAWEEVVELADSGSSGHLRVTGTNKGGVVGEVLGLRGFIPRSHLIEKDDLDSLVGQTLSATFLEVDPERNKLVLSQRDAARAAVISRLERGQLVAGKVASIKPYGVFVDLDEVTGLLHIKQVSGSHIDSLNTLFKIGQPIQVMILELDEFKNRISLSTKVLENYPGEILENMDEVMASAPERAEQAKSKGLT
ncbi:MAG: S1 RNA-binding domain-containing protein [Cyanophyceae cyanobacterium]